MKKKPFPFGRILSEDQMRAAAKTATSIQEDTRLAMLDGANVLAAFALAHLSPKKRLTCYKEIVASCLRHTHGVAVRIGLQGLVEIYRGKELRSYVSIPKETEVTEFGERLLLIQINQVVKNPGMYVYIVSPEDMKGVEKKLEMLEAWRYVLHTLVNILTEGKPPSRRAALLMLAGIGGDRHPLVRRMMINYVRPAVTRHMSIEDLNSYCAEPTEGIPSDMLEIFQHAKNRHEEKATEEAAVPRPTPQITPTPD